MVMAKGVVKPAALVSVFALAGCLNGAGDGLFSTRGNGTNLHAMPTTQVMTTSFTIAGPRGYCIDPGATRDTAAAAFAVLGSCAVISGNPRDSKPKFPAMLTASVTAADAPLDAGALDRLAAFFSTDEGRGALARADAAGDVAIIDMAREEGLLLVHAQDGDRSGDVTGDYWRGIFETAGRLVTVTVSGFQAAPLDDKSGAGLTRSFVAAIRKANPAGGTGATDHNVAAGGGMMATAADRLASLFNRLP